MCEKGIIGRFRSGGKPGNTVKCCVIAYDYLLLTKNLMLDGSMRWTCTHTIGVFFPKCRLNTSGSSVFAVISIPLSKIAGERYRLKTE